MYENEEIYRACLFADNVQIEINKIIKNNLIILYEEMYSYEYVFAGSHEQAPEWSDYLYSLELNITLYVSEHDKIEFKHHTSVRSYHLYDREITKKWIIYEAKAICDFILSIIKEEHIIMAVEK